jgi:hypothetical protein
MLGRMESFDTLYLSPFACNREGWKEGILLPLNRSLVQQRNALEPYC